ncbi:hypothetical protein D3C81_565100 [compost metagenome]
MPIKIQLVAKNPRVKLTDDVDKVRVCIEAIGLEGAQGTQIPMVESYFEFLLDEDSAHSLLTQLQAAKTALA